MPPTLVLSRADLRRVVDVKALTDDLRAAFGHYDEAVGGAQRIRERVGSGVTAMVLVPGTSASIPAYTVKVHAKNAARRPALTGVICLHDRDSGDLLALLDSGWLTAVRTGAGSALGADLLARPGPIRVGVIGAGAQGRAQLAALGTLRQVSAVDVFDVDAVAAHEFVRWAANSLGSPAQAQETVPAASAAADVVLVATWGRGPVLGLGDVGPGAFVTSLGADEPGKAELEGALLEEAFVVTDDRRLAGPILPRVDATLSELLRGEHPARRDGDITVYSPVGLPMQDCVAAWHAYRAARAAGAGLHVDLEAEQE